MQTKQLPFLGLSFYWAWVTVVFYSDALVPGVVGDGSIIETIWLWATWSHMLALLVHVALARYLPSILNHRVFRIGGIVGMMLCSAAIPLLLVFFNPASSFQIIIILGVTVLLGIASAWHLLLWGELYTTLPPKQTTVPSLFSFAGGLLLYFVVIVFPVFITTAMAVLLPLFSGLSMVVGRHQIESENQEKNVKHSDSEPVVLKKFPGGLILSTIALFVFALCGEILRVFSLQLTDTSINHMGSLYLLGGIIGLMALTAHFLLPIGKKEEKRISLSLVRNVLILMAIAFLVAPFVSGYSIAVSYGIFGAGFWCVRAISWIVCFLLIARFRYLPIRVIGVLDGAFALSVVVSAQLSSWLVESIKVGSTELTTVSLITVFVLMFIAIFVLNGKETRMVLQGVDPESPRAEVFEGMPSRDEELVRCMQSLAEEFGLSPRETEVATLLAKGRSLPFIQGELHISAGTAQTHARHIYRKLSIHSRQELLDAVEERLSRA